MTERNLYRVCYARLRQNDKANGKLVDRELVMWRRDEDLFTAWFQGPYDWVIARIHDVRKSPYDVRLHYQPGYILD